MSSPIRDNQIQADRANRVKYKQALLDKELADPAYQARVEQAKIDRQEQEQALRARFPEPAGLSNLKTRAFDPIPPIPTASISIDLSARPFGLPRKGAVEQQIANIFARSGMRRQPNLSFGSSFMSPQPNLFGSSPYTRFTSRF